MSCINYVPVLCNDCLRLFLVDYDKYVANGCSLPCVCGSNEICHCGDCMDIVDKLISWNQNGCPGAFYYGLQNPIAYWRPFDGCVKYDEDLPV
jgi:hypothetical protein